MAKKFVTATALAAHLGLTRQYVAKAADLGMFERQPGGGFDIDKSRLRYIAWLRSPERRNARAEADAEVRKIKARALQLRVAKEEGRLIEFAETQKFMQELIGEFRSSLDGLGARVTRDLALRRTIDAEVTSMLHKLADRVATMEPRSRAYENAHF